MWDWIEAIERGVEDIADYVWEKVVHTEKSLEQCFYTYKKAARCIGKIPDYVDIPCLSLIKHIFDAIQTAINEHGTAACEKEIGLAASIPGNALSCASLGTGAVAKMFLEGFEWLSPSTWKVSKDWIIVFLASYGSLTIPAKLVEFLGCPKIDEIEGGNPWATTTTTTTNPWAVRCRYSRCD